MKCWNVGLCVCDFRRVHTGPRSATLHAAGSSKAGVSEPQSATPCHHRLLTSAPTHDDDDDDDDVVVVVADDVTGTGIAATVGIPSSEYMPAILNRSLDMYALIKPSLCTESEEACARVSLCACVSSGVRMCATLLHRLHCFVSLLARWYILADARGTWPVNEWVSTGQPELRGSMLLDLGTSTRLRRSF